MFQLVTDESAQELGIEIHKKRTYEFQTSLFAGNVTHDSTGKDFLVIVQPNYRNMAAISDTKKDITLSQEFDAARVHELSLGLYNSLDVVDWALINLENWYREVLKKSGAGNRFLVQDDNELHLVFDDRASDLGYTDAIIRARNIQAFNMMRENKDLSYEVVVGKIMPIFLQALGLKEYHLTHDLSEDGNGEVKFIIEKVGAFAFFKPQEPGKPAYFERYSYLNGDYHRSFAGETRGDIVKKFVFEWLVGAAREQNLQLRDDHDAYMDELAEDVKRTWITPKPAETTYEAPKPILQTGNVVSLGAFRHS